MRSSGQTSRPADRACGRSGSLLSRGVFSVCAAAHGHSFGQTKSSADHRDQETVHRNALFSGIPHEAHMYRLGKPSFEGATETPHGDWFRNNLAGPAHFDHSFPD
jgi:hypothetical protein